MKKILVLDNDPDILDLLKIVLEDEGYKVIILEETNDILKLVRDFKPDLLLVDFALNDINGGEVCRRLKMNKETARLPIILFSAYNKTFLHPEKFGCDEFIAKPFDLDHLLSRIRQLTPLKIAGDEEQQN